MDKSVIWILWAVGAYLVGSIPFGFLIGKLRGKDIRTLGSKNIGATNVYRTVGKPWGILAFLCDFLKGFLPTLAAQKFGNADWLPLMVGILTVAGHMWTCFMKFKGGKGIATGFGMLVALTPVLVLTAFRHRGRSCRAGCGRLRQHRSPRRKTSPTRCGSCRFRGP